MRATFRRVKVGADVLPAIRALGQAMNREQIGVFDVAERAGLSPWTLQNILRGTTASPPLGNVVALLAVVGLRLVVRPVPGFSIALPPGRFCGLRIGRGVAPLVRRLAEVMAGARVSCRRAALMSGLGAGVVHQWLAGRAEPGIAHLAVVFAALGYDLRTAYIWHRDAAEGAGGRGARVDCGFPAAGGGGRDTRCCFTPGVGCRLPPEIVSAPVR